MRPIRAGRDARRAPRSCQSTLTARWTVPSVSGRRTMPAASSIQSSLHRSWTSLVDEEDAPAGRQGGRPGRPRRRRTARGHVREEEAEEDDVDRATARARWHRRPRSVTLAGPRPEAVELEHLGRRIGHDAARQRSRRGCRSTGRCRRRARSRGRVARTRAAPPGWPSRLRQRVRLRHARSRRTPRARAR